MIISKDNYYEEDEKLFSTGNDELDDILEEDIAGAGYKILKTLDKLRYKVIDTTDEGFEDDCFININDMEEFRRISGHMRCGIR